ncbi:MAG: HlyD family efflux transporter periplasmic adaptor subunit [Burkholderiales bacterium]|nr:HlyD family efflux transporter periplasmic adaptor subunit [Burkholderiales bacterium]MDE2629278.1 HlyD family efflux transporter periplasmic adaptor subunit [Burkholderiales bacterium]
MLTWFAVLVAAAVATYLVLGEYTRKARVTGYLVPDRGVIRLVAPQPATVVESHAADGRSVRRGDVLFVLDIGPSTLSGDTQAAVQSSLALRERSLHGAARQRTQLEQSQLDALDRQIDAMRRELDSMATETDLQRQRLALAQQAQAQFESLRNQNFVSAAQVRAKAEEVLNVKAQLQGLERQRAAHLREIAGLQAQRRDLPLRAQAAQGEIDRDLAALAQQAAESEARQRVVVRAPEDGVLSGVLAEPGQAVTPAVALASLLPAGARLQAQLFAPSSAVGFVRADQTVELRYQAFPYQKFGHQSGEVVQVSRSPLQASELAALSLPAAASATGEPLYRITVRLDRQSVAAYGQAQALAPGMQLEADVLLDRRRLIEWLFEPVLGIAGRG